MPHCQLIPVNCVVWVITSLVILSGFDGCNSTVVVLDMKEQRLMEFADRGAYFGPDLPPQGLYGHIMYAEPNDACELIAPPPKTNITTNATAWIALVVRYPCHFSEKVLNARKSHYDAVIVYNNGSDKLVAMHSDGAADVDIPSVFVGQSSGNKLHQFHNRTDVTILLIESPQPLSFAYFIVLGCIGGLGIMLGFCIVFVNYLCHRARKRMSLLSKRKLKKLPVHKFKTGDRFESCAICLEEYVDAERLRVLPCGHAFHCRCIDPWLTEKMNTCPLCKDVVGRRVAAREAATSDERRPLLLLSDTENDGEAATGAAAGLVNDAGIEIVAEVHSSAASGNPAPAPVYRSYGSVDETASTPPPLPFILAAAAAAANDEILPDDRVAHFTIETPPSYDPAPGPDGYASPAEETIVLGKAGVGNPADRCFV